MSHGDALEAIDRILAGDGDVLQPVVDVLHDDFENYSWVGIYLVEGDDLVPVPGMARKPPSTCASRSARGSAAQLRPPGRRRSWTT